MPMGQFDRFGVEPDESAYHRRQRLTRSATRARALVARPRLLLLDEPMSSLDAELKAGLLNELAALQRTLNVTTLHVTHDREEAARFARRVVSMREGKVERVETTAGISRGH